MRPLGQNGYLLPALLEDGKVPSAEAFLQRFHAEHDGSSWDDPSNAKGSSYDILAEVVPRTGAGRQLDVLDLGCGSGRLLEVLAGRSEPDLNLTGIDLVPEQIDRARARLAGHDVELCHASATAMPLADASQDIVLIHMGLFVMRPLEQALAEIDRVLKPGGKLAIVVDGPPRPASLDSRYAAILSARVRQDHPEDAINALFDRRASDPDSLATLVAEGTAFDQALDVLEFEQTLSLTAEEFLEFAAGDYLWRLLSPDGIRDVADQVIALFPDRDATRVCVPIAMRRMILWKAAEVLSE